MAIVPVAKNIFQSGADTPALTLTIGNTLNLSANAGIFAAGTGLGADGIVAGGANTMNILGDIFSREGSGIQSDAGNHVVSIAASGSVYGLAGGLDFGAGGNTITNAGQISAATGLAVTIGGTGSNVVNNSGSIQSGSATAVHLGGTGNTFNNSGSVEAAENQFAVLMSGAVVNTGTIQGGAGIQFLAGANSLANSGELIVALGSAVLGSGNVETITNTGLIHGGSGDAVYLNAGNDVYDGRGGQVIGAIRGGIGTDTLSGGTFVDRLEGEEENDHINGGGGGDYIDGGIGYDFARYDFATTGVQARLDNAALNTGEAAGDTMYNFEGLVGSQFGDILAGNDLAIGNQIYGLGGNDTIRGNGGADILYGGAGSDSIFTGAGTDTVWVQAADRIATQQDRVFDFTDGQDHLRFQGISAASATITDSQGGTLIQFNIAGGQYSVFLDNITKAASADQIFFV